MVAANKASVPYFSFMKHPVPVLKRKWPDSFLGKCRRSGDLYSFLRRPYGEYLPNQGQLYIRIRVYREGTPYLPPFSSQPAFAVGVSEDIKLKKIRRRACSLVAGYNRSSNQSFQKFLNLSGDNSVYRTVCGYSCAPCTPGLPGCHAPWRQDSIRPRTVTWGVDRKPDLRQFPGPRDDLPSRRSCHWTSALSGEDRRRVRVFPEQLP